MATTSILAPTDGSLGMLPASRKSKLGTRNTGVNFECSKDISRCTVYVQIKGRGQQAIGGHGHGPEVDAVQTAVQSSRGWRWRIAEARRMLPEGTGPEMNVVQDYRCA